MSRFKSSVVDPLCQKFQVGNSCSSQFQYIGVNVTQTEGGISIDQLDYIENVRPVALDR